MAEYLPFTQSDNNYTMHVPLNGTTYDFDVRWNSSDAAWYLDLYEADRTPIATSLKVVLGPPLGHSLQYLPFFQEHILQVLDTTNSGADAAYDDLGGRIQVLHMSMDEFRGNG